MGVDPNPEKFAVTEELTSLPTSSTIALFDLGFFFFLFFFFKQNQTLRYLYNVNFKTRCYYKLSLGRGCDDKWMTEVNPIAYGAIGRLVYSAPLTREQEAMHHSI